MRGRSNGSASRKAASLAPSPACPALRLAAAAPRCPVPPADSYVVVTASCARVISHRPPRAAWSLVQLTEHPPRAPAASRRPRRAPRDGVRGEERPQDRVGVQDDPRTSEKPSSISCMRGFPPRPAARHARSPVAVRSAVRERITSAMRIRNVWIFRCTSRRSGQRRSAMLPSPS